jgi:hypothetical protein
MPAFHPRLAGLALAAALTLPLPVLAGPLTDAATAAEAALASGDMAAWAAAYEGLSDAAWSAGGFYIARHVATTGDAPAFGMYEARANTVYGTTEPIRLYVEPRGYGYGQAGDGVNQIAFDIDLAIRDGAGAVVGEVPGFSEVVIPSRARPRELMVNLTATLNGAPPGDYVLVFTFRDRNGGGAASFEQPVTLQ